MEELELAVKSPDLFESHGPDGINSKFGQLHREMIKHELFPAVCWFMEAEDL